LTSAAALGAENSKLSSAVVKPLSWGNRSEAIDLGTSFFGNPEPSSSHRNLTHIICSDLVLSFTKHHVSILTTQQIYFPDLFAPLLRTLLDLTSPPFTSELSDTVVGPLIFISYKVRSLTKESTFWAAFGLWFEFRPVLVRRKSNSTQWRCFGVDSEDTTFLFVARRRPESCYWTTLLSDKDLLSGVGANGTGSPKLDDTFENLLMMISLEHE
jgi:hypothetical protein